jgi:hypothetical protein
MMNIQKVALVGCIAVIVFVLCLFTVRADAKDLIPRADFIKYTEACMAVTDVMDIEFSKDKISVIAINELKNQFDICMKKIERYTYKEGYSRNSQQLDIRETLDHIGGKTALMIALIGYIDSMGWNSSANKEEIMRTEIKLASTLSDVKKTIYKLNSQYIIYKDKPTGSR